MHRHGEEISRRWSRERFEDAGFEDWSDVDISQGKFAAFKTRRGKEWILSRASTGTAALPALLLLPHEADFCFLSSRIVRE